MAGASSLPADRTALLPPFHRAPSSDRLLGLPSANSTRPTTTISSSQSPILFAFPWPLTYLFQSSRQLLAFAIQSFGSSPFGPLLNHHQRSHLPRDSFSVSSSSDVLYDGTTQLLPLSSCLRCLHSGQNPRLLLVSSNQIKLVPFFVRTFIHSRFSSFGRFPFAQVETQRVVNVSPFVDSLFPSPSTVSRFHIHRFSPKTFRQRCSTPPPRHLLLPPPLNSNLRPSWSAFWSLPISLSCPNVWYRYLHRKIPHNSLLNRFLPEVFPSSSCAICQHPLDSLDHFLFSCPSKLVVWHHIQRVYLGDLGSLHFFRPPPDPHHLMLAQSSR
ncbi:hypothetical protein, partial, partial [Parasitella parasitica]